MRGKQISPGVTPKLRWLGTIEVDWLSSLPRARFRFREHDEQDGELLVPADEGGRSQENSRLGGRAARKSVSCQFVSMDRSLIACRMVDRYVQTREWHLSLPRS